MPDVPATTEEPTTTAEMMFNADEVTLPQGIATASTEVKEMLILKACGFSRNKIARMFGVSPPTVTNRLAKVDPDGIVKYSPEMAKNITAMKMQDRLFAALDNLTDAKLKEASADRIGQVINVLSTHLEKMGAAAKKPTMDLQGLMLRLKTMGHGQPRLVGSATIIESLSAGDAEQDDSRESDEESCHPSPEEPSGQSAAIA